MREDEIRSFLFIEGASPAVIDLVVRARRENYNLRRVGAMAKAAGAGSVAEKREACYAAERFGACANTLSWVLEIMKGVEKWGN